MKKNIENITYGEYLRKKREELGISVRGLALKIDLSRSFISNLETNKLKNPPTTKSLKEIIKGYKLNEDEKNDLLYLIDLSRISEDVRGTYTLDRKMYDVSIVKKEPEEPCQCNVVKLPVYGQVSAGKGRINMGNILRYETITTLPGDNLPPGAFGVDVVGESMWPTLLDGDLAIIDPRCEDVNLNGEICVISYESEEYIKRIKIKDKYVVLMSDNPDREEFEDIIIPRTEFSDFRCHGVMIESRRRYKKK